jgi:S1-C subfamily serine protease
MNPFRDGVAAGPPQLLRTTLRKSPGTTITATTSGGTAGFGLTVGPLAPPPSSRPEEEAAVLAVQRVAPGGAAAAAGVRVGDVLLELCGVSVRGRGAAGMHEALAAVAAAQEAAAGDGRPVDVSWVFQRAAEAKLSGGSPFAPV